MDWVGATIAVVAALFAGWQAFEARKARTEAKNSAAEAQQYEQRAVEASERIASAIEEQNATARAERQQYRTPWSFGAEVVRGGSGWKLRLGGNESVSGVTLTFEPDESGIDTLGDVPNTMDPGESIHIRWWKSLASPAQARMRLSWTRPNGEQHSAVETLH